jgi:hypothetical protein
VFDPAPPPPLPGPPAPPRPVTLVLPFAGATAPGATTAREVGEQGRPACRTGRAAGWTRPPPPAVPAVVPPAPAPPPAATGAPVARCCCRRRRRPHPPQTPRCGRHWSQRGRNPPVPVPVPLVGPRATGRASDVDVPACRRPRCRPRRCHPNCRLRRCRLLRRWRCRRRPSDGDRGVPPPPASLPAGVPVLFRPVPPAPPVTDAHRGWDRGERELLESAAPPAPPPPPALLASVGAEVHHRRHRQRRRHVHGDPSVRACGPVPRVGPGDGVRLQVEGTLDVLEEAGGQVVTGIGLLSSRRRASRRSCRPIRR